MFLIARLLSSPEVVERPLSGSGTAESGLAEVIIQQEQLEAKEGVPFIKEEVRKKCKKL